MAFPLYTRSQIITAANHVLDVTVALSLDVTAFQDSFMIDVLENIRAPSSIPEVQEAMAAELTAYAEGLRDYMRVTLIKHHCEFVYRHNGSLYKVDDVVRALSTEQMMQATVAYVWTGTDLAFTPWSAPIPNHAASRLAGLSEVAA